jgi:hypothetical protein
VLGNTFTRHGQSQIDNLKSFEPYIERGDTKSPFSNPSIDLVKIPSHSVNKISIETTVSIEKSLRTENSSPSLRPVVSAFSTYSQTELPAEKGRSSPYGGTEWKRSHPSPVEEEDEVSDSSKSSFDTTWAPEQPEPVAGGLAAPKHARAKESREKLVRKASGEKSPVKSPSRGLPSSSSADKR